jgi:hypothetical protein
MDRSMIKDKCEHCPLKGSATRCWGESGIAPPGLVCGIAATGDPAKLAEIVRVSEGLPLDPRPKMPPRAPQIAPEPPPVEGQADRRPRPASPPGGRQSPRGTSRRAVAESGARKLASDEGLSLEEWASIHKVQTVKRCCGTCLYVLPSDG